MNLTTIFILTPLYVLWYLIVSDIWSGRIFDWVGFLMECVNKTQIDRTMSVSDDEENEGEMVMRMMMQDLILWWFVFLYRQKAIFWCPLPKTQHNIDLTCGFLQFENEKYH